MIANLNLTNVMWSLQLAGLVGRILLPNDSFHKLAEEGNWKQASKLIDRDDSKIYEIHMAKTALHISVIHGKDKLALRLVTKMPGDLLEERDDDGYTALAYVAALGGSVKLAESMIRKKPSLVGIKTNEDSIPVLLSSANGNKDLTRCIFHATPVDILREESNRDGACIGALLLLNCLKSRIFGEFPFLHNFWVMHGQSSILLL